MMGRSFQEPVFPHGVGEGGLCLRCLWGFVEKKARVLASWRALWKPLGTCTNLPSLEKEHVGDSLRPLAMPKVRVWVHSLVTDLAGLENS